MLRLNQVITIRPFATLPQVEKQAVVVSEDSDYYVAEYCIGSALKLFSFMREGYENDWQVEE